jgi:hypothetical protein
MIRWDHFIDDGFVFIFNRIEKRYNVIWEIQKEAIDVDRKRGVIMVIMVIRIAIELV